MDWFFNFPDMSRSDLREFKKTVDFAFTDFSRSYGAGIEDFFEPLLMFLVWFEKLFINTPWPLIILSIPLILCWIPGAEGWVDRGFEQLSKAPDWYFYSLGIAISASFGVRGAQAFFKRK